MRRFVKWLSYLLSSVAVAAGTAFVFWHHDCLVLSEELLRAGAVPTPRITRATLLFGGDVMVHKPQLEEALGSNGYSFDTTFSLLGELFDSVDLAVVNFETTLRRQPPFTGYPCFRSPEAIAGALKRIGVDAVMLANNHICDGAAEGLSQTVDAMQQYGIAYTGAFSDSTQIDSRNPLYLDAGPMTVAILNYTFGTNGLPVPKGMAVNRIDTVRMGEDLARIDTSRADIVCVMLHWGEEYMRTPSRQQQQIASFLRGRGVRLIIGSHPHVIQPIECDPHGAWAVAYSLGNMVSNQQWRFSDGGMLLHVELTRVGNAPVSIRLQPIPVWVFPHGHIILPEAVADTLSMPEYLRMRYQRFKDDFNQMINNQQNTI